MNILEVKLVEGRGDRLFFMFHGEKGISTPLKGKTMELSSQQGWG